MVERPCRTNSDLKRLWQILLPDTPLPPCDIADQRDTRQDENSGKRDGDEPREKPLSRRE